MVQYSVVRSESLSHSLFSAVFPVHVILPSAERIESLDADEITFTPSFDKYWDD